MIRYYDKDGRPLTVGEWQRLFEDKEYRRIGHTVLPDGSVLSTVWLGLDHSHPGGDGPPIIFETMRFPGNGDMWRWGTLEEALAGHQQLIEAEGHPGPQRAGAP